MQYSIAICSRPEGANDVVFGRFVSLTVPDNTAKLRDYELKCFREILLQVVGEGIFHGFLEITSDRKAKVAYDVTSYRSNFRGSRYGCLCEIW